MCCLASTRASSLKSPYARRVAGQLRGSDYPGFAVRSRHSGVTVFRRFKVMRNRLCATLLTNLERPLRIQVQLAESVGIYGSLSRPIVFGIAKTYSVLDSQLLMLRR